MNNKEYGKTIQNYARKYPDAGYGGNFFQWIFSDKREPYNSWGNGSAMRVSAVGFAFKNHEDIMQEAKKSAEVTHNHPEGIKGAQATAMAVHLALTRKSKEEVKAFIERNFHYDLSRSIAEIKPNYDFDVSCQGSVPEAIIAFLESENFESAVRIAISLGGDSDTQACIAGAIAHAFYKKIPRNIMQKIQEILPGELYQVAEKFCETYQIPF
jgi:ADP-ribosylglycohydrolase